MAAPVEVKLIGEVNLVVALLNICRRPGIKLNRVLILDSRSASSLKFSSSNFNWVRRATKSAGIGGMGCKGGGVGGAC